MEPIDLMDDLEREIENLLEPPNLAFEDPLSQRQSILETQMENTVEYKPTTPVTLPPVTPLKEPKPIRGIRSPDPSPVEYDRTGLYQPPVFGAGLRPTHAGMGGYQRSLLGFGHIRSNKVTIKSSEKVFCEAAKDYVELTKCYECDEWNPIKEECSHEKRKESPEE